MVFPVVLYGCESWTIKKAEHWRIDTFKLCCWRRLLRFPCPLSPGVCSVPCPLSLWGYLTISSSVVPFFFCLQSFPARAMSPLFTSGGQSIGVSASTSVLPMNTQDCFPLGGTGWISLQSKGLSRVFYRTTIRKHQFFSAQPSLWSNSHNHTWQLGKT